MKLVAMTLVMVMAVTSWALGADAAGTGNAPAAVEQPPLIDERAKVAEIDALFRAAKYDEAIEAAKGFLRAAKDEKLKMEANRLVAESLRKKGDWKLAPGAYQKLRDRCDRSSPEYVRYDAVVEVLRSSPTGVYQPAGLPNSQAFASPPKPLSDDAALEESLVRLAELRLERLKPRVNAVKRARTVQDVLAALVPLAEEFYAVHLLSANLSPEPEREAAQAAGMKLADIGKQTVATLEAKLAEFQEIIRMRRLTAAHRKEMEKCQALCNDMAKAEDSFQAAMDKMAGTSGWPEGIQLRNDSTQRRAQYQKLAGQFTPPPMGNGARDARDAAEWGRTIAPPTGFGGEGRRW